MAPCATQALDVTRRPSEYTSQAFSVEHGLPHNSIHSIAQTPDGYLWLGTWEGAARFDGRRFTVFDRHNVRGMQGEGVRALVVAADGSLHLGAADGGVLQLREGSWQRIGDAALASQSVTTMSAARDGSLWIGTEDAGLVHVDRAGKVTRFDMQGGLSSNWINAILAEADGALLVATNSGVDLIRGRTVEAYGQLRGLPAGPVRALSRARDGTLRVGGFMGLWRLQEDRFVREEWLPDEVYVQALLEDRDRALWIATSGNGLLRRYDDRLELLDTRLGLHGVGISALFEDAEGLLWVGTTAGLHRIADGAVSALDRVHGLTDVYTRTILQDRAGIVWMGTGNGVHGFPDGVWLGSEIVSEMTGRSILSLAEAPDGALWIGTYSVGLLRRGPERRALTMRDGLVSNQIRALLTTADGALWIGTPNGLQRLDATGLQTFTKAQGLPRDYIRSIYQAPDGRLWVGTNSGAASLEADGRFRAYTRATGLAAGDVFDFLGDPDGTLWLATDSGLLRLRDGRFEVFDEINGLPNDTLYRILEDSFGNLWISSNSGVFRLPRRQIDELLRGARTELVPNLLSADDGMPSSQCNGGSSPAGWRTRDGRLWFPTAAGVAVVTPAVMDRVPSGAVPSVIEDFAVDGQSRGTNQALDLGPGAKRLSITYAGLSFRAPKNVRYRFRLHGYDNDWVDAGERATADYTNLAPGKYRFEVQATLTPVVWTEQSDLRAATLSFTLRPPFWRSLWFIGGVLFLLIASLYFGHRRRVAALTRRQLELTQLVDLRTSDLSAKNIALELADHERADLLLQLAHMASHDALTGLPNRRAGDERLRTKFCEAQANQRPFSVALLDIDHFKRINDQYSHQSGDTALRWVATRIREFLNSGETVARYGGEEFLLVFPDAACACAAERCDALRAAIAARPCPIDEQTALPITVSIGLATLGAHVSVESLLAEADQCLYRAKALGRNQVVTKAVAP